MDSSPSKRVGCRCLSDRHGVCFSGSGRVFSVKGTFSLIVFVSGLYTLFWIYYNISNVFSFERSSIFSGRYSYVTGNDDYFDFELLLALTGDFQFLMCRELMKQKCSCLNFGLNMV